ncbi:MAG: hypothetical protein V5788_04595 [Shewanella sp.]
MDNIAKQFFGDILFSFILYTTGALVLRVVSFGWIQKPFFSPDVFSHEKKLARNDFFLAYISGFFFYLVLLALIVWLK